jgi:hypothetical protein
MTFMLCRDVIAFFTAFAAAKCLLDHTGDAYETVPELTIVGAFITDGVPIIYGVAMANPESALILLGSDDSQLDADNAEAPPLSVGKQMRREGLVEDHNVTIAGHAQEYIVGLRLDPHPRRIWPANAPQRWRGPRCAVRQPLPRVFRPTAACACRRGCA